MVKIKDNFLDQLRQVVFIARHYGISCLCWNVLLTCYLFNLFSVLLCLDQAYMCSLVKKSSITFIPRFDISKRTMYDIFCFFFELQIWAFGGHRKIIWAAQLSSHIVYPQFQLSPPIILLGSHSISCVAFFLLLIVTQFEEPESSVFLVVTLELKNWPFYNCEKYTFL